MLTRHLWALCKLAMLHTLASWSFLFFAFICYGRPGWLLYPPLFLFYFPSFILKSLGANLDPLENPFDLVLNTACWVTLIYPLWLAGHSLVLGRNRATIPRRETP